MDEGSSRSELEYDIAKTYDYGNMFSSVVGCDTLPSSLWSKTYLGKDLSVCKDLYLTQKGVSLCLNGCGRNIFRYTQPMYAYVRNSFPPPSPVLQGL